MHDAVPHGWELSSVGRFGKVVTGSTPSTKEAIYWDGEVPFISPADFNGSVYVGQSEKTLTAIGASRSRLLPKDTILVTCIGSLGGIAIASNECTTNQQINAVVTNTENDSRFCYYNILFNIDELAKRAGTTTIPIINKSTFELISLLRPPLEQQQKIAHILSTIDNLIEKTQALIDKYTAVKQGMMHDLFTRGIDLATGELRPSYEQAPQLYKETELGWVPKEWEIAALSRKSVIKGGKRLPLDDDYSMNPTLFRYLRTQDFINRILDLNELQFLKNDTFDILKNYEIHNGNIFISIAGVNLGVSGVLYTGGSPEKIILTENAAKIILSGSDIPTFVSREINSFIIQKQISEEKGIGAGVPKLALHRISSLLMLWPSVSEQESINLKFENIERQLNTLSIENSQYMDIKKGLMHDLLTGRVRVN